jgi:wobble nucleotide-excising tRNase
MGKSLTEIAEQLKDSNKKVQLIYAFNGNGKTRLSREFKLLVQPKNDDEPEIQGLSSKKIIYYNAFTEDLFYWDNDLSYDVDLKLKIHPNSFTDWVFKEQGQDQNVIGHFQNYTNRALTPRFNPNFTEIAFTFEKGDDTPSDNIKISKGEESNFVWSVFFSLLDQIVDVLNTPDPTERETDKFNQLKYVFIDDPVTSLDDNHLIQVAVDLAQLIKRSDEASGLKFIISTHNPIFYNVLHNEIRTKKCFMLDKEEDGTFELYEKPGDSNKSFSYHLHLKKTIEEALENNQVQRYHFTLLRNLYEKTASFLGYPSWSELLPPGNRELFYKRIINFTSHSTLANESIAEPSPQEKQVVRRLLEYLTDNYSYWKEM